MGYRSEVRCLIYPRETAVGDEPKLNDNYHALKTVMNTTFKEVVDYWSEWIRFDDQHRVFDFAIDHVKWYASYPEVNKFEAMLAEIEDLGYEYEFVRVGEDEDDIDRRMSENDSGYLSTSTSITCYF
jgi:hypothetical protein